MAVNREDFQEAIVKIGRVTKVVKGGHKYNASKILLRPASEGTGLIAGGAARPVLELSGVKDIIAKSLGSNNPNNLVQATVEALAKIKG